MGEIDPSGRWRKMTTNQETAPETKMQLIMQFISPPPSPCGLPPEGISFVLNQT